MFIVVRLDGVGFSKLTAKKYTKPYSQVFADHMVHTASVVAKAVSADVAYVGSDEISLIIDSRRCPYNTSTQKLISICAGLASSAFTIVTGSTEPVAFDARSVDHFWSAADYVQERRRSVKRNAVSDVVYWQLLNSGKYSPTTATTALKDVPLADRYKMVIQPMTPHQEFGSVVTAAWTGLPSGQLTLDLFKVVAEYLFTQEHLAPPFDRAQRELQRIADSLVSTVPVLVTAQRVVWAESFLAALKTKGYPAPTAVSLTADGTVRFEWHRQDAITSVDFETDGGLEVVSTTQGATSWSRTYETITQLLDDVDTLGARLATLVSYC